MKTSDFISKNKNKLLNLGLLIVALMVSNNIYKHELKVMENLKSGNNMEIKKNTLLNDIAKSKKTLDSYKALLVEKETGVLISEISKMAKESNVSIESIRPLQEQKGSEVTRQPFLLNISASSYHSLAKFISRVENYKDVFVVESFQVATAVQNKPISAIMTLSSITFVD